MNFSFKNWVEHWLDNRKKHDPLHIALLSQLDAPDFLKHSHIYQALIVRGYEDEAGQLQRIDINSDEYKDYIEILIKKIFEKHPLFQKEF